MAETREFTLVFYFASDNPLARRIVSQLKALKQAGFHSEAKVIVHFDPNADATPVHIFDVNRVNKIRADGKPKIGCSLNPPFVRNLVEDKLWKKQNKRNHQSGPLIRWKPPGHSTLKGVSFRVVTTHSRTASYSLFVASEIFHSL